MDLVLAPAAGRGSGSASTSAGRATSRDRIVGTVRSNGSAPVANPRSLIVCSVRISPWVICSTWPVIAAASLRLIASSVIDWIFVSRFSISA